ncbi:MAG: WG repeat-containing protein [Myxococcota bacterium]
MSRGLPRGLALAAGAGVLGLGLVLAVSQWSGQEDRWRWGFVDGTGRIVVPTALEGARGFQNGRAAALLGGAWGFVDRSGVFVVPPRFRQLCDYGGTEPTCAQDAASGEWGYIDETGAWVFDQRWAVAHPMVDGLAAVGEVVGEGAPRIGAGPTRLVHFGLLARDGTLGVPIRPEGDPQAWTAVGAWGEGLLPVQVGGKRYGYVDRSGAFVLDPFYKAAKPFLNGFAGVSGSGGWAVVARDGTVVVPESSKGLADGASEGLIAGPTGYFAVDGTPVGPRFEWVRPHVGGLGAVFASGTWGFVDTAVELVIPREYRRVSDFSDGRAVAAVPGVAPQPFRWGIVDTTGAWVVEPRWDAADESGFHEGLLAVGIAPEEAP